MAIPNTIFSKTLSLADVEDVLAIPTMSLCDFPAIPEGQSHVFMAIMGEDERVWNLRIPKRRGGHPKPVFSSEDNKHNDGNNGGGGGGGSGGNNKKESRDREGDYNGDKDKRSRDDGGGDVTGKNMDFMGGAFFGYKFGYHAGNENGYPVGQLKCVQVVQ